MKDFNFQGLYFQSFRKKEKKRRRKGKRRRRRKRRLLRGRKAC
jgi:hypothetical protein